MLVSCCVSRCWGGGGHNHVSQPWPHGNVRPVGRPDIQGNRQNFTRVDGKQGSGSESCPGLELGGGAASVDTRGQCGHERPGTAAMEGNSLGPVIKDRRQRES